ncbi:MAG: methionine--tRNA ligase [Candidatus Levybacteria bacterium]|nr:methionine--tRNA ligase [Candidatus Levybacteria bacterium]
MNNKFYITNAIPYVNAKPHIGHALEFVQSDTIARYHRLLGDETLLLCGGDENAIKNVQAAEKAKRPIQEFVDENSAIFHELSRKLNVEFDVWQKGSDPKHHSSSQKLWELCLKKGDIYKQSYKGLYCVGCELFYGEEELDKDRECFEHPGKKLEEVSEENYFFKLSKYQEQIENIIKSGEFQIIPDRRKNEALSFIKQGLKDISISRSNERARNWGVRVPNDPTQRMYVWFDALNIYQSGVGFALDEKKYNKWWPADLHVIGKGILRFHAIYWPAFLLSAGLNLPKKLFVHEYITVNGQKMSKTTGNVIDPIPLIEKYGADALRYYLLAKVSPFSDGDFSEEKLKETYNADLANGLGNLVARVAKLCERVILKLSPTPKFSEDYKKAIEGFKFNEILENIWNEIRKLDQQINKKEPWKIKEKEKLKQFLQSIVNNIINIAFELKPFLPETSKKIEEQFKESKIVSQKPLFPRI